MTNVNTDSVTLVLINFYLDTMLNRMSVLTFAQRAMNQVGELLLCQEGAKYFWSLSIVDCPLTVCTALMGGWSGETKLPS